MLQVARATSAAPVYFAPETIKDSKDGEVKTYADGGIFANNPAGLGFALSALNVKAENIRVISIGTGYKDYNLEEEDESSGIFSSIWKKTKKYFGSWKDYLLEVAQLKDTDG